MSVYLREVQNPSSEFLFPSEPDKNVEIKRATNYQDFNFIGIGKRSYPMGMGAQSVKWNGYFWGSAKQNLSSHNTSWQSPEECISRLQKWQEEGTELNLIITSAGINVDVTIQNFNPKPFGGHGDYSYEISFLQHTEIQIYTTNEVGTSGAKKSKTNRSSSSSSKKKTYKVKKGDTLKKISQKKYKTPKKWINIYNANNKVIEKAAKKHGRKSSNKGKYIYAGTVLTIP